MRRYLPVAMVFILLLSSVPAMGLDPTGEKTFQPPSFSFNAPARASPPSNNSTGLYGIIGYDDVALLVNDNSAVSREIGTYFAERRGIPPENIINLSVPTTEQISSAQFDEMARQVKENLSKRGLTDKIDYMVTTKGLPLGVSISSWRSASVDSELMLLDGPYESNIHAGGWIENPYFEAWEPFSKEKYGIRLVTRLDGYTVREIKGLIDRAEASLGARGRALLDTDPTKGYQSGGYGEGNLWMVNAHDWLVENEHESLLDMNNTFRTGWTNTFAYYSWGSNDGNWNAAQLLNGGFEYGTGPDATSWTRNGTGGLAERSQEKVGNDAWSMKLFRNATGKVMAYQNYTLAYPDHRYIIDARASITSVTTPGARVYVAAFDMWGSEVSRIEVYNRTGTRNWESAQKVLENRTDIVRISIVLELLGTGTAYFDNIGLRVIRPHNTWVPGSIAETCVSTGGRSLNYGTWYGQSLVADLIRDGVTGVKGYVYEPYLSAMSHADILFPAYYSSYSLAEAYYMGSQLGSWMDTVIGDPKCTPFLDERADMGFALDREPISTFVLDGDPYLSIALYNKGKSAVVSGLVDLSMDGKSVWSEEVTIPPLSGLVLNISHHELPMIGHHNFSVLLNGDGAVWEYDYTNDAASAVLDVNHIPVLTVETSSLSVARTESMMVTARIVDLDPDISLGALDLYIAWQGGGTFRPVLLGQNGTASDLTAMFDLTPPWNCTVGFHSIMASYTDRNGSFSIVEKKGMLKVTNALPVLSGNLSATEVPRGATLNASLLWSDPDTPDGRLTVSIQANGASWGAIEPDSSRTIDNWSSEFSFDIPVDDPSEPWTVSAVVKDRDGASATWEGDLRTVNGAPEVRVISGLGSDITRLEKAVLSLEYYDPEGLMSRQLNLRVYGPEGNPSGTVVLEREMSLHSGESADLEVFGSSLAIGEYSLEVEYEDDEREPGSDTYPGALSVHNIAPSIGEPLLTYPTGEGPPGGTLTRGSAMTIAVPMSDPDAQVPDLRFTSSLYQPSGDLWKELSLSPRGDGSYSTRIVTDSAWPVGSYSLIVEAKDSDGGEADLTEGSLFDLVAPYPTFESGGVFVRLNSTFVAEVTIMTGIGSSRPGSVWLSLFDANGTHVAEIELSPSVGFSIWTGEGPLTGPPSIGAIRVQDDLGRTFYMNRTLTIEFEEPVKVDDDDAGTVQDDDDDLLLYLLLIAFLVVALLAVVLLVMAIKKRREPQMIAAPPMIIPLEPSPAAGALKGSGQQALPPGSPVDPSGQAPMTRPKELLDGTLYHRPGSKPPKETRPRSEAPAERPEVARAPAPVQGPPKAEVTGSSLPGKPPPIPPPPMPPMEGLNRTEAVGGPVTDVPDTDSAHSAGDPGQGVPPIVQGQSGGP